MLGICAKIWYRPETIGVRCNSVDSCWKRYGMALQIILELKIQDASRGEHIDV